MPAVVSSEFDLHIWKRSASDGRPALFTIGIWNGLLSIESVCHIQPLEDALSTLRQILETAGHTDLDARRNQPSTAPSLGSEVD
jgi:hypothetical protein